MKIANFRLFPYLMVTLAAGIITAAFYKLFISLSVIIISLSVIMLCIKSRYFKIILTGCISVIAGVVITSCALYINHRKDYLDAAIRGRITENIIRTENYTSFGIDNIEADGKRISGSASVIVSNEIIAYEMLECGDILTFRGNLESKELNPFDSRQVRAYRLKIYYQASVNEVLNRENGRIKPDEKIRMQIIGLLTNAIEDEDSRALAYALITGDKYFLDKKVYDDIAISGIAHVFAVSGLHIAILGGAVYYLLNLLRAGRKAKIIITSLILVIYAYICGFPPSINRAVLMCVIVMYGRMSGRRNDLLSAISLSALILLLINPINLFDLSFIMSYGAVFGIILLYKPMDRIMQDLPSKVRPLVISSLSTNIMLFPVITGYFHRLSLYFLIANLIVLPVIAFLYIMLLAGVIIGLIIPKITLFIQIAGLMLTGVNMISHYISMLPLSSLEIGSMGMFAVFYYIAVLLVSDYILLRKDIAVKAFGVLSVMSMLGIICALITLH